MTAAGRRPRLVLVPGLLCDASVFVHQVRALAGLAEVQVADVSQADSIEGMARSALSLFEGPINLVGFSMGGRAALAAVRLAPERVERLCLMDTGFAPAREGEAAARQVLLDLAEAEGMAGLARDWLPPMVHVERERDEALMGPLREMVLRADAALHERQIRALLARPDATPHLSAIRCPTLVMVGRQDRWSTLAQHEALAAAIPGARLTIIEDSGHFTPVERPEAVSAALADWIRWPLHGEKEAAA